MQSPTKPHNNTSRTQSRRATIPTRVPLHWQSSERQGRKTRLLPIHRRGQVRNPVPSEVLRASDARVVELVQRARHPGNIGYLFEPIAQGDGLELHR